ncbi:hypothetical protein [Roseovarius sp. D22-M7]|uniref:hypothetical protein n=1 Tax=Roseovarius sp. D22-M7 TaxID=3127116 RepID=UPI003010243D
MKHDNQFDETCGDLTGAARHRHMKREAAVWALQSLDEQDAAVICATFLDEIGAAAPRLDYWGDVREGAGYWAYCANSAELEAYFTSALKRLRNQALGIKARKRMIAALFLSLTDNDKRAFLAWAGG